jgi:ferritin-like metal-binding protein YciE/pimeloyl-ACP methyl ester carboxylesterase
VQVLGRPVHLLEQGAGRPLLLLHGCGSLAQEILSAMPAAPGLRWIAPDRPGYGFSAPRRGRDAPVDQARWTAALLDALGLGRVHLVAHSLAAGAALEFAARAPGRVAAERLVLAAGPEIGAMDRRVSSPPPRPPARRGASPRRAAAGPAPAAATVARYVTGLRDHAAPDQPALTPSAALRLRRDAARRYDPLSVAMATSAGRRLGWLPPSHGRSLAGRIPRSGSRSRPRARPFLPSIPAEGAHTMDRTKINDHLDTWLRNAHAMEKQAEQMLQGQANRIDNYPELAQRIERHLAETRGQVDMLEAVMERRGISPSAFKDIAGQFTAMMQAMGGATMSDEVVKGGAASYAFEHFEIAAYRVLAAAAEEAGDMEAARVCRQICAEEEAMAADLERMLPEVVRAFLQRSASEIAEAKR